jgi:hypothetical protein
VLIDPQFAPKVIVKAGVASMVELIAATAKREDVDLFPRFNVMKPWSEVDHIAFETFVSPDGLHMNDWGYACMAEGLGVAIAEAAQRAGRLSEGDVATGALRARVPYRLVLKVPGGNVCCWHKADVSMSQSMSAIEGKAPVVSFKFRGGSF